jgi:ATP synthase protein I
VFSVRRRQEVSICEIRDKNRLTNPDPCDKNKKIKMIMAALDNKKDTVRSMLRYSSLGLEMGLCVAIGVAIGYFLDKYFHTYPYMSIIFMFVGIFAALKAIYTMAKKMEKDNERNNTK